MVRTPTLSSSLESLALLTEEERTEIIRGLSQDQVNHLLWDWRFWARPKQLPPDGAWRNWLIRCGRGWGKDWVGGNWTHERAKVEPRWIALIASTPSDARDFMIEGPAGILKQTKPSELPEYEPSKRRLSWPNGSWATVFSAAEPDQLRGFSGDTAWIDELGKFRNASEVWRNLQFGMRECSADQPRILITTTPRPLRLLKTIQELPSTITTVGSSYENRANLDPGWFRETLAPFEGTSFGRQEIHGELLEEAEGALWKRAWIDNNRVPSGYSTDFTRVVVAIDPAVTATEDSDETGIIVAGMMGRREESHGYILADGSGRYSPDDWANKAISLFDQMQADRVVAEVNNGGDLVEATLRMVRRDVSYEAVHASRGKQTRAEPIAALYQQGRIHHVGSFPELEDQLCNWEPGGGKSPDRLDALVWALTELMVEDKGSPGIKSFTL